MRGHHEGTIFYSKSERRWVAAISLPNGLAALGLPPITWHDLRHSAASVMLTAGVPLRVIADILGHSTIRVTADLYAHVGPELQREAAEKMEEALR